MGKLINLNPFAPIADADIPAAIARDTEVTAAVNGHLAAADPHIQYLLQSEGDARYRQKALPESFNPSLKIVAYSSNTLSPPANTFPISTGLEIQAENANSGAFFLFHRFAISGYHFGIDHITDALSIGGWSFGGNSHRIWHANYGTPVWQTPSDRFLKEDIHPIPSALALILEAKPIRFRYNRKIRDKKDFFADSFQRDKIHYGFLANEFPLQDLVSEKKDGYLGLDYLETIPFLFRAIQELHEQIAALKKQIGLAESVRKVNSVWVFRPKK